MLLVMGNSFKSRVCLINPGNGMRSFTWFHAIIFCLIPSLGLAYRYDPALVDWNLNENQYALSATVSDRLCAWYQPQTAG